MKNFYFSLFAAACLSLSVAATARTQVITQADGSKAPPSSESPAAPPFTAPTTALNTAPTTAPTTAPSISMDQAYLDRLIVARAAIAKSGKTLKIDQEMANVKANPCPLQTRSACQAQLSGIGDTTLNFGKISQDLKACERHIVPSAYNPEPECLCMANLYLYSVRQSTVKNPDGTYRDDHSMGFDKSDADLMASQNSVASGMAAKGYPDMFEVPAEIKNLYNNPSQRIPDNYRELLPKNWKAIEYSSRSIATPGGNSFRRLLIVVPGKAFDRYVQLTMPNAQEPNTKEKIVNFQVIQKIDEKTGATLAKPKINFREIWRTYSKGSPVTFKPHEGQQEACITCHPNGMRELSPSPGSVGHGQLQQMDEINAMMRGYGPVDWADTIRMPSSDPKKLSSMGPPVGERVGCTRCHNGQPPTRDNPHQRDPLSEETSSQTLRMKVTEDMTMPIRPRMDHFLDLVRKFEDSVTPAEYRQMQSEFVHYNHQDGGNNTEVYERMLKRMLSKQQITKEYYDETVGDLKEFRADSKEVYESYARNIGKDRTAWLKDHRCEPVMPAAATIRPAAPETSGKH